MIENENQYNVTKLQLAKLKVSLEKNLKLINSVPEKIQNVFIEGIKSQIKTLENEIADYEKNL